MSRNKRAAQRSNKPPKSTTISVSWNKGVLAMDHLADRGGAAAPPASPTESDSRGACDEACSPEQPAAPTGDATDAPRPAAATARCKAESDTEPPAASSDSSTEPSRPAPETQSPEGEGLAPTAPAPEESTAPAPTETAQPPADRPSVLRGGIPRMYVVQITPELAPVAKVGGLGDVVFGLSRELEWRGNTVETILPKYDCMRYDKIWGLAPCFNDLWVPWHGGHIHCTVYSGSVDGRSAYFIEPHSRENFFNRGCYYGNHDDIFRYAFFSRAAMEFLYKSGKRPEIIHCHDWQTGLVPVFLYEIYQHLGMDRSRVCYTIHNFRHQGVTGEHLLTAAALGNPGWLNRPDRLRDPRNGSAINLMKGGIVYSNFVTTVSPRHAGEVRHDQGCALEQTLHTHHAKFGGVLNGVDYGVWNPEIDPHIARRYGADTIEGKYENKRALRHRFWLADNAKPIIAFIGRLDEQKGLDLVRHAAFCAIRSNAQFLLLGSAPDHRVGNQFWNLKRELNNSPDCHIELGFDEELSHLIYAGSDFMLVPSRYEPCGLSQLIALRYGTVPIVREVGGLADSVFDKDHSSRPLDERNGYVFQHYDHHAIESVLSRALACYYSYPQHFRELMLNGMHADYSWNYPGQHYLNIYDYIRAK